MNDVRWLAFEFSKSVLIDCELISYRPSVVACALINACITVKLKAFTPENLVKLEKYKQIYLIEFDICNQIWENLVHYLFGASSVHHMDLFGKFLISKQKLILNPKLEKIYKPKIMEFY